MDESNTSMNWFPSPDRDASILSAWDRMVQGDMSRSRMLRGVVDRSWHRCLDGQVSPGLDCAPPPLEEDRLFDLRNTNERLLSASLPTILQTREFLLQTGTVLLLTDADGMILELAGDQSSWEPAGEIRLIPGCGWTELNCGTNAIGTALALGQPVQIHGAEHFCEGIKRWTCSATVIRDPLDGSVLGVIDHSGLAQSYNQQSLALIVSLAAQIESRLGKVAMERRLRLLERCTGYAARAHGVIVTDERGRLVQANARAQAALARLGVSTGIHHVFPRPELAMIARGVMPPEMPDWLRQVQIEAINEGADTLGFLLAISAAGRRPDYRSSHYP
ncbi:MAG: sigma-54 dependent transcriptional regulator, acetoin dehydrogenase operon transcriptional [Paraburkholderia sp.]|uniref:GAF domain-containing protein n=1 Tax=Paraburkholderia sp. TaxID=1926495 RepID=UPI002AFFB969|nr:GAF domain-containing protein [Paraburkholderia sp.]MEA3087157.1 sigma-54 dependent transcriptional regulator, acetoin dehydrogenase operon transcriptional [Paraburkholderia sp.]MEA3128652.1 sigma-54 dependent transcriptional regulator, acetoin dehydrogenase operon transcriptional [Paraburkholderia sp.]